MTEVFQRFELGNHRFAYVEDVTYETRGSFAYDTEAETKAAEDHELEKLRTGEWVALGLLVFEPCGNEKHCHDCNGWTETDSIWGVVIQPDDDELLSYACEFVGIEPYTLHQDGVTRYYFNCKTCEEAKKSKSTFFPPHVASDACRSGGHTHCTCDTCF